MIFYEYFVNNLSFTITFFLKIDTSVKKNRYLWKFSWKFHRYFVEKIRHPCFVLVLPKYGNFHGNIDGNVDFSILHHEELLIITFNQNRVTTPTNKRIEQLDHVTNLWANVTKRKERPNKTKTWDKEDLTFE